MKDFSQAAKDCPVLMAQRVLSGKWSLAIIHYLGRQTLRFGELQRKLPFLTQATLSRQLKDLVEQGIVVRHDYQEIPPRVEYKLTEAGKGLLPIIASLEQWGQTYFEMNGK